MRDVLDVQRLVFLLDGLLHGDDVHADAGASRRDHRGDAFQRHLGHQVEEGGQIRVLGGQFVVHHHEFGGAGHEDGDVVLAVMVLVFAVHLQHADPAEVPAHLFGVLFAHVVHLGELRDVVGDAGLPEVQQEARFFLGQDFVQGPELGVVRLHGVRILHQIAVGDHGAELQDDLLFFLVLADVGGQIGSVHVVEHAVFLFLHAIVPSFMSKLYVQYSRLPLEGKVSRRSRDG